MRTVIVPAEGVQVGGVVVPEERITVEDDCGGMAVGCVGPDNACFESKREVATKWTYVGEGNGGYAVARDFNYVGENRGDFQQEEVTTYTSCRPRLCCVFCLAFLISTSIVLAVVLVRVRVDRDPDIPVTRPRDPYSCAISGGVSSPITRALIDTAWRCLDTDRDNFIDNAELQGCEALSHRVVSLLSSADSDRDGKLCRREFEQALIQDTGSSAHHLWLTADQNNDGKVDHSEIMASENAATLPSGLVASLLTADRNADGVLSYDEFLAQAQLSGSSQQLANAAWLIVDTHGIGSVTSSRLAELAAWAEIPSHVMMQLIPDGSNSISQAEFIAEMAGLPAERWPPSQRAWCCSFKGVCLATSTTETAVTMPQTTIHLRFNCHDGYHHWWQTWSPEKQHWCCDHFARGCPVTKAPPLPDPSSQPFDCNAGYSNWKAGWSEQKKFWCCRHFRRGCQDYDCESNAATWATDWTPKKKVWCCAHTGLGCAQPVTEPYDCDAGYSNWQKGWSHGKKDWCCRHHLRGCQPADEDYDCQAGYSNWEKGWSDGKKVWCCQHHHLACSFSAGVVYGSNHASGSGGATYGISGSSYGSNHASGSSGATYGISGSSYGSNHASGSSGAAYGISGSSYVSHGVHGDLYTNGDLYDCRAGYSDWETRWSNAKKGWCCHHKARGCPDGGKPYDCSAGYDNWQNGWSEGKKEYCCRREQRGCVDSYDCSKDYSDWKAMWSDRRQDWCCRHKHKGCRYDCRAGLANWESGWSHSKKKWCCDHSGLGCADRS